MKTTVRIHLCFLIVNAISIVSYAQDPPPSWAPKLVPATPNATKMTEYQGQRPAMYTGTANVSIPLHTIDFEGWSLPLSLSYNATGIRPNEEASEVGLGWSLSATGVISRSINGGDDLNQGQTGSESTKGYVYDSIVRTEMGYIDGDPDRYLPPDDSYYWHLAHHKPDTQPDIFNYNFFGYSGSFTLSQKLAGPIKAVKLTEDACRITFDETAQTFTIITPQGFKGSFTIKERSTTYSSTVPTGTSETNNLLCCSEGYIDTQAHQKTGQFRTTTSWYLSTIKSPRGKILTFTYDINPDGTTPYKSLSRAFGEFPDIGAPRLCIQTVHEHTYLKKIQSEDVQVDFTMAVRDDVRKNTLLTTLFPGGSGSKLRRYTNIQVTGLDSSTLVKQITLKQSYFNQNYYNLNADTENEVLFLRSRLDRVIIDDQEYSFFYERPNELPGKMTSAIDHFGFYNGVVQSQDMLLPPEPLPGESFDGTLLTIGDVMATKYYHQKYTRLPDINYGKIGILTKVQYPTRGYSVFEYESHRYAPRQDLPFRELGGTPEGNLAGGARILSITDYDYNDNPVLKKQYRYRNNPDSTFSKTTGRIMTPLYNRYAAYKSGDEVYDMSYRTHSGIPGSTAAQGKIIGYDKVHEIIGLNNSYRNVYFFENRQNRVTDFNTTAGGWPNLNGQSRKVQNYNSAGQVVQATFEDDYYKVTGSVLGMTFEAASNGEFLNYHVPYELERTFIMPKTSTVYTAATPSTMVVNWRDSITNFGTKSLQLVTTKSFSDTTFLLRSQQFTNSTGVVEKTIYKRPWDYTTASAALAYMKDPAVNMVENVIEEISKKNNTVIGARGNLYGLASDTLVNLLSSYSYNPLNGSFSGSTTGGYFPSTYDLKVNFTRYDKDGRLQEYTSPDGIKNAFIWAYNNKLPIVHGLDIDYVSLRQAHVAALSGNYEADIRSHANTTGKQITTYRHNPLVGVTKVTDPNRNKTSYEYDTSERLSTIKDTDDNILKQYRYHLIQRKPTRILAVSSSTGSTLNFGTVVRDFFEDGFFPYNKCGTATRTFTITNTGEDDLQISDIQLPLGFTTESLGLGTIPAGVSTDIQVKFNEAENLPNGSYGGNILFVSNKTGGASSFPVTAVLADRVCSLGVPSTYDFGTTTGGFVGGSLTVYNNGNGPLRIAGVPLDWDGQSENFTSFTRPDFSVSTPSTNCLDALNGSQTLSIHFTPQVAGPPLSTVLTIVTDVEGCTVSITLTGQRTN